MFDEPRTYPLLDPAIFTANESHVIIPLQHELFALYKKLAGQGSYPVVNDILLLFIAGMM